MMATKDRVFIDMENRDFAAESNLLPSDRMEQFFVLMAVGFKERRKEPLESGITNEMFLTHQRLGRFNESIDEKKSLIYALALYDKNMKYFEDKKRGLEPNEKFVNVEDEKEMYKIAEQYANGGAYYLRELEESTSLYEKNVLEKEIKRYLRKITKE